MAAIIVHCYYTGAAGAARGFIREMQRSGLQQAVRNEDGCLQYDYYFSAQDETDCALLEKWRDGPALAAHMNGEPMRKLQAVKERYGLETTVERYEVKD